MALTAQKYTYFGFGMGLISTRFQVADYPLVPHSGSIMTGGLYDVYFRQNITDFFKHRIWH
jgi:hypothetical protein